MSLFDELLDPVLRNAEQPRDSINTHTVRDPFSDFIYLIPAEHWLEATASVDPRSDLEDACTTQLRHFSSP